MAADGRSSCSKWYSGCRKRAARVILGAEGPNLPRCCRRCGAHTGKMLERSRAHSHTPLAAAPVLIHTRKMGLSVSVAKPWPQTLARKVVVCLCFSSSRRGDIGMYNGRTKKRANHNGCASTCRSSAATVRARAGGAAAATQGAGLLLAQ